MITIWKYPLKHTKEQVIEIPLHAKPLCVKSQDNTVCIWYEVDSAYQKVPRKVRIYGTGWTLNDKFNAFTYVGTCLTDDDTFVWHVYVETDRF